MDMRCFFLPPLKLKMFRCHSLSSMDVPYHCCCSIYRWICWSATDRRTDRPLDALIVEVVCRKSKPNPGLSAWLGCRSVGALTSFILAWHDMRMGCPFSTVRLPEFRNAPTLLHSSDSSYMCFTSAVYFLFWLPYYCNPTAAAAWKTRKSWRFTVKCALSLTTQFFVNTTNINIQQRFHFLLLGHLLGAMPFAPLSMGIVAINLGMPNIIIVFYYKPRVIIIILVLLFNF